MNKIVPPIDGNKPTRAEAEAAIRTLIQWAGDDPDREGLIDTPSRVVRSYEKFYQGYTADPRALLERTFEEVEGILKSYFCAIFALNPIASTIWLQLLVAHTLPIFLTSGLSAYQNLRV